MKLNQLREFVKQVVREENDYQQLFKTMLDKYGKSITDMSDDEKKKFFNAVDTAYKAKSEGRLRGYNENINEISSIDGLTDVVKGQTSHIEGMKLSKGMAEHIISWMNTSPYGKKYNPWVKKNSIEKILPIAFNWGLERGLPSNLKNEFSALKAKYGKAEKKEELTAGQKKIDVDGDGEIEGSDLAALRNKKEENINEAKDAEGNEFPELDDVKAAIKKMIQNDAVEKLLKNKVISYLQKEKRFDGAGNTNSMRLYDKAINDLLKN